MGSVRDSSEGGVIEGQWGGREWEGKEGNERRERKRKKERRKKGREEKEGRITLDRWIELNGGGRHGL